MNNLENYGIHDLRQNVKPVCKWFNQLALATGVEEGRPHQNCEYLLIPAA